MPIAITDTQRGIAESIRDWAVRACPIDVVRSGETQPVTGLGPLWSQLAELGVFGIAVPEELGGAGASVADAVAAVEAAAGVLAPGPVASTVAAALLLSRYPDAAVAKELVPELAAGTAQAAIALGVGAVTGRIADDGGLVVTGAVGLVPDAHIGTETHAGTHLLLAAAVDGEEQWFVLAPGHAGVGVAPELSLDLARPLARVHLIDVHVPSTAVVTGLRTAAVLDWTATIAAADIAGLTQWCLRTAADYANVREQFGSKIGSFQAIKALCTGMLTRAERTAALAWDAARAADESAEQHHIAATAALASALDAAVDNAKDCIQVLGGIGFTFEHDAHLYFRRAIAWRQLLGGSGKWRRAAAEQALAGARRRLEVSPNDYEGDVGVTDAERAEIRIEAERVAALPVSERRAALAANGYLVPHWPRPYGLDASPALQLVIDAELRAAGVARPDLVIGAWAAPTILGHGTAEQSERFVLPTLRGDIFWCQLFSEPGAGSDLASLRTKATRDTGGWVLNGQKVWTSVAHKADWAICLARTDGDVAKHKGITYFLVDMRSPGVDIRPLRELTGDVRFNEVFLEDVFVPDECVVGEINGGWRLARTTLANERVAMSGGSTLGENLEKLLVAASSTDAVMLDHLGELISEAAACAVLDLRAVVLSLGGQDPGPGSSVRKLIGVHHRQAVAEQAMELLGPDGAVAIRDEEHDPIAWEFLVTRCLSIAGGTTQILTNVAAEQLLGLPRG